MKVFIILIRKIKGWKISQNPRQVGGLYKLQVATTQLNSTQSWVSLIFLCKQQPQTTKPNRIPLYLSSYTTKLDQIQYATLFQPNQKIHAKKIGSPPPQKKIYKFDFEPILNLIRPNSVSHLISTSTRRFMHRTILSFFQPQPNSIQNKNNPIG